MPQPMTLRSLPFGFRRRLGYNKTGAVRKTPLMRVKDGDSYILVGSQGGAPTHPAWVHNLRVNSDVEIRDETVVRPMRVREVKDEAERSRLWQHRHSTCGFEESEGDAHPLTPQASLLDRGATCGPSYWVIGGLHVTL